MSLVLGSVLVAGLISLAPAPAPPPGGGASSVHYRPPVAEPVIDHFRPPACAWCPGNRGIDYRTRPGEPVGAAAAGLVTFAGQVGGQLFVVLSHADGLRTTYAFLASVLVRVGQRVAQGEPVGSAGAELHFGVRRGEVYLDPELLFAGGRLVARLVPLMGGRPDRMGP